MDIQSIPRTFWHSISLAILIVSAGLTHVAYKSSDVSIELANAKIDLSSEVASSTIALKNALTQAKKAKEATEQKYATLLKNYKTMQKQVAALKDQALNDKDIAHSLDVLEDNCPTCVELTPLPDTIALDDVETNIKDAQQSLDNLIEISKKIKPIRHQK